MDRVSKTQRKWNMSRIRHKDTSPELKVRKFLWAKGYRYRVNVKSLPGTPDIVLLRFKTIIFINGCFWHGHQNCKNFVIPKTRTDFWENKITTTISRDKKNQYILTEMGWKVIIIWECDLTKKKIHLTLQALDLSLSRTLLKHNQKTTQILN